MSLIIEDGSGANPAANSYGTVIDARAYALSRGATLSAVDADVEVLMIKAMDYIEAQRAKYKGEIASTAQPLQWPRYDAYGVVADGVLFPSDEIPNILINAQYALAMESVAEDLQPSRLPETKGVVVREKVEGAVEVQYSDTGARPDAPLTPVFSKAEALLKPLYKNSDAFFIRS